MLPSPGEVLYGMTEVVLVEKGVLVDILLFYASGAEGGYTWIRPCDPVSSGMNLC